MNLHAQLISRLFLLLINYQQISLIIVTHKIFKLKTNASRERLKLVVPSLGIRTPPRGCKIKLHDCEFIELESRKKKILLHKIMLIYQCFLLTNYWVVLHLKASETFLIKQPRSQNHSLVEETFATCDEGS